MQSTYIGYQSLRAQKLDLAPEFCSNNPLNIDDDDDDDDEIIDEIRINDDSKDDENCSGDNNEFDEVQVIKPMKTSVNGAIDTL